MSNLFYGQSTASMLSTPIINDQAIVNGIYSDTEYEIGIRTNDYNHSETRNLDDFLIFNPNPKSILNTNQIITTPEESGQININWLKYPNRLSSKYWQNIEDTIAINKANNFKMTYDIMDKTSLNLYLRNADIYSPQYYYTYYVMNSNQILAINFTTQSNILFDFDFNILKRTLKSDNLTNTQYPIFRCLDESFINIVRKFTDIYFHKSVLNFDTMLSIVNDAPVEHSYRFERKNTFALPDGRIFTNFLVYDFLNEVIENVYPQNLTETFILPFLLPNGNIIAFAQSVYNSYRISFKRYMILNPVSKRYQLYNLDFSFLSYDEYTYFDYEYCILPQNKIFFICNCMDSSNNRKKVIFLILDLINNSIVTFEPPSYPNYSSYWYPSEYYLTSPILMHDGRILIFNRIYRNSYQTASAPSLQNTPICFNPDTLQIEQIFPYNWRMQPGRICCMPNGKIILDGCAYVTSPHSTEMSNANASSILSSSTNNYGKLYDYETYQSDYIQRTLNLTTWM